MSVADVAGVMATNVSRTPRRFTNCDSPFVIPCTRRSIRDGSIAPKKTHYDTKQKNYSKSFTCLIYECVYGKNEIRIANAYFEHASSFVSSTHPYLPLCTALIYMCTHPRENTFCGGHVNKFIWSRICP